MKKKRLKIIRIFILTIVIIIIMAIVAPGLFANKALKIAIEKAGTRALSVNVNVDEVDLSILGGKLRIEDLMIDNPEGYQHERLLELNQGDIEIETKSLLSDTVEIENITLDGTKVVFEQRGISSNNLQDILKKLPEKEEQTEPTGKKLHIKKLEITNTEVQVKLLPVPGRMDTIPLKLSTITLTDLGKNNKLDTIALCREILLAIAAGIAQQGADIIPDEMLNSFMTELQRFGALSDVLLNSTKKILEAGTDIGKEAKKIGDSLNEGVLDNIEDTGKGITEGLKGIFKQDNEE